jgi:type IV secretion system protein VirD4
MYMLSRLFLMLGMAGVGVCAAIMAVVGWPASGLFAGILLAAHLYRKRSTRLTTLGSARWADENDLRRAGMLDADSGLILGRLVGASGRAKPRIRGLFAWRLTAKEACQRFWFAGGQARNQLVRLPNVVHVSVFAPSGAGKLVSLISFFLLNCRDSAVCIDFKGELATLTAWFRRKVLGHQVVLLDPYRIVTQTPDSFNAVEFIPKDSPIAIDECNEMAKALVIRSADEKEPHWNDAACWPAWAVSSPISPTRKRTPS